VIRVSTGSSVQFENRVPRMLKRDFTPGGTIDISYKDQELETAFAKRLGDHQAVREACRRHGR
jgi:3-hydroxyisobutyrate dehydrogenase-like beta-hydroxyacid dehydrogenase